MNPLFLLGIGIAAFGIFSGDKKPAEKPEEKPAEKPEEKPEEKPAADPEKVEGGTGE